MKDSTQLTPKEKIGYYQNRIRMLKEIKANGGVNPALPSANFQTPGHLDSSIEILEEKLFQAMGEL